MNLNPPPGQSDRRSFFKEAAAVIIGTLATLVPLISGVVVLFDPLRKKSSGGDFVFVAPLSALPEDDLPRKFSVIAGHTDAWSRIPPAPIGAVYLRRVSQAVEAFSVVCPHLGCFVDFNADTKSYLCPCHKSTFAIDGKINDPRSPSPRGMDRLKVEIREGNEVWVKFQNFRTGEAQQIPA